MNKLGQYSIKRSFMSSSISSYGLNQERGYLGYFRISVETGTTIWQTQRQLEY